MVNDPFPPASRYYLLGTGTVTAADGTQIVYALRRFVPPPNRFQVLMQYTVIQGQRVDQIAARVLNDPQRYCNYATATV